MRTMKLGCYWPGFFFGLGLLAMTGIAAAQPQASSDYLSRMDRDHDGRVSLVEYQDWLSYGFDAMDRNHDGVLSADELPARGGQGGRGHPLTREEHRARLAAAFHRQDRNGDGFLDSRELAAPPS
jgi:Ca2+-binding EF-hand superfamily protein